MITDLKKSIQLVLSERITSPFSGAFFFSWIVWNWKMLYTLFFADEAMLLQERFLFIETNFLSWKFNLLFPVFSAIILTTIYPFLSTGSLWVWLKFKKWQTDLRNQIEEKQLLTLEQSMALRLEIRNQLDSFEKILQSRNLEISSLKEQLEAKQSEISELQQSRTVVSLGPLTDEVALNNEYQEIMARANIHNAFSHLIEYIQAGWAISKEIISPNTLAFFDSRDIIQKKSSGQYEFTPKGKYFVKLYTGGVR